MKIVWTSVRAYSIITILDLNDTDDVIGRVRLKDGFSKGFALETRTVPIAFHNDANRCLVTAVSSVNPALIGCHDAELQHNNILKQFNRKNYM